jgi:hypothetical protein
MGLLRRANRWLGGGGGVVHFGVPSQSLGSELLVNGDFSAWTANNPNGWTVTGESGTDPEISQVGSGEGHGGSGTGLANTFASTATFNPIISQSVATIGAYFELSILVDTLVSGTLEFEEASGTGSLAVTCGAGVNRAVGRAANATIRIRTASASHNITFDNASVKRITPNSQLTAPSANMRIEGFYTLPVSPVKGDQLWVMPRISDFSSGNYWLAHLLFTGTQWDLTLYSVATHIRTSRISATNVGATNGIAINMNGDNISLYTTANGGTNWTQRGTTISNATYNTATGVNALFSSTVTPGNLIYKPAE